MREEITGDLDELFAVRSAREACASSVSRRGRLRV
jgi:hypothetical protein